MSIEQTNKLEQENTELKAGAQILSDELDKYKSVVIKQLEEIERLKAECDMYKTFYRAKHSDIKGLLFKYKQTLQEIQAIATGVRSYLKVPAPRDVRYEMDRIIDLITKVEEEWEY